MWMNDGGKKPEWNESFEIEIDSPGDDIKFTCLDEDTLVNDVIGERSMKV